jgi:hypothetical protein
MQEFRNALGCIVSILHYDRYINAGHPAETELKMTMQTLRETTDAREFETQLRALRNTRRHLDAIDLAEIAALRNRIDECDEIARILISAMDVDAVAKCVASSVDNALLAVDHFASARGDQYDSTILNDGSIDAWGWSESTREGEMNWRVTIRIIEESDL